MGKYVKFLVYLDGAPHLIVGEELLSNERVLSVEVFSDHTLSCDLKKYENIDFTKKRSIFNKGDISKFSELAEEPIIQNQAFDDFEY